MPSCSVKWCSNHTSTCSLKSRNGVSFHRFPKDKATCQKWVEAVRLERRDPWWTSSNASRICSLHFKESDISSTPCKVNILAKTAVPICTMVWYDNNENNIPPKTSIERTVNTILRTYERKKSNMNVLKESKVNLSYNWNKESTTISNTNTIVISNMTQDSVAQATKLIKTLEVSETQNLKEVLEPNSDANIDLKTSDRINVTAPENKTVLTEFNKKEYIKYCKEQCCKSKILVKLNDNTSLILDEAHSNDSDTNFKESNKIGKESNLRTCGNSKKVSLKELKSNENKEPNQKVINMSNSDMFVKTITNGNAELNANISKSYVGKMLKTYLPKRKDKIIDKNIRETCKQIQKNNGLKTVKCKEVNNITVNKCVKDNFNKKLNNGMCIKTNIIPNLHPNKNSQEKTQIRVFKNAKKITFKRSNFFNRQRIREQNKQTVGVEPNKDDNKESNITHIDEFISNQSRFEMNTCIGNNKEKDTSVYDEIISELFEASKNVENVSDIPSNGNYQESNESMSIESNTMLCTDNNMDTALGKGTVNTNVILDLDTNIYRELNKRMNFKLCSEINTGLNDEINKEVNTDKMATNENFPQINENKVTELKQLMSIMNKIMPTEHSDHLIPESQYYLHTEINGNIKTQCNKNMCYNENIITNSIIISNNELQNLEKSVVNKIVTETKKDEFTELKRHLSMKPKLDSMSELSTNTLRDIHNHLYNIMSTAIAKENIQVPDRDNNAEFDKNTDTEVNDKDTSLHSNINTDANKATDSNVTSSKELNSILLEEFITNLSPGSNSESIDLESDINTECKKICEKDMPDLNTTMNLELCSEGNIGFNDEMNTDSPDINTNFRQPNQNIGAELNQQPSIMNKNMPMEHNGHLVSESHYYLHTKMNGDIISQDNQNICCNENITNNALILSNNEMQNLDTSVVNKIVTETKKDEFTELKKKLSTKPNLDSFAELCTSPLAETDINSFSKYNSTMSTTISKEILKVPDRDHNTQFDKNANIEINDIVTSLPNNINIDDTTETESNVTSSKQFNSILLQEFIPNISPDSNNVGNKNFINNSKTDANTTRPTLNNKMFSDINIECKEIVEKDMLELNTVILSELNEDRVLKPKEVINRKFYNLNTTDKDLLRKSNKNSINVLATSDDQHTVVNEHMDVVDSILNRDIAAEFDLSLLLSDTPIPDEEIQNVDNSNNNSLDGIGGSPNWIQLPTGEMPKIIDDILEQNSPFFENLDLFDKVNKFNIDKEANKKDKEIKKLIKNSNFEQFEEQIINNVYEIDKRSTKNNIAQIKKQLIAEFSDYNDSSLEQSNNICNENEVREVTAEKCYNLYDTQIDKQILEQYFHPNNEQCHKIKRNQIVEKCYEHSDKEIQCSDKTLNQCQKQNNVDSKTNQIENPSSNLHFGPNFEKSEKSHKDWDGLGIDKSHDGILNNENILELSKKQYDKESNERTYQSIVGKLINMEESTPKSTIHSQVTLESTFQEINNQLSKDCNDESIDKVNNISNEEHIAGTEKVHELNVGQLKRAIFEQCYDPECQNDCKNQKHNSNIESHKKDVQGHEKQTNFTSCYPDIEQWKRRYDLLDKRQCNQSGIDNFKNRLNDEPFDPTIKHLKSKCFSESQELSGDEKCITKYKKIAIGHIPGKYLELRWKESEGKSNTSSQEGCKRKHKELDLDQRKILCRESTNNYSQQIMAECPECGYSTDDNDLMNYKSDVDLRITKPLSLINKDMLISLCDIETENNGNNKRVALESVYAMELAYVTAIQALERKLKQKIAISEYRLKRVNNLSKINNTLIKANIILKGFHKNKM